MDWNAIEAIGVIATLGFLSYQMMLQSRSVRHDSRLRQFELYQNLLNQHTELLKMADRDPVLNEIWEPMDPERRRELDRAQAENDWGAWYAMTPEEQRCYRYTRYAVELFEQAYKVNKYKLMDAEIWDKWISWMEVWPRSRYFKYMFEDNARKFIPSFVDNYWALVALSEERDREAVKARGSVVDALHSPAAAEEDGAAV
ncbi:hypothetical protein [Glycomyces tenuis]|uniref:hypothetical protein n=1 Tax=Glycomyces tenuis TaxID=58116 RepID=UPI0003FA2259|nr:hypothetical protein [Glycomyces tenuis]